MAESHKKTEVTYWNLAELVLECARLKIIDPKNLVDFLHQPQVRMLEERFLCLQGLVLTLKTVLTSDETVSASSTDSAPRSLGSSIEELTGFETVSQSAKSGDEIHRFESFQRQVLSCPIFDSFQHFQDVLINLDPDKFSAFSEEVENEDKEMRELLMDVFTHTVLLVQPQGVPPCTLKVWLTRVRISLDRILLLAKRQEVPNLLRIPFPVRVSDSAKAEEWAEKCAELSQLIKQMAEKPSALCLPELCTLVFRSRRTMYHRVLRRHLVRRNVKEGSAERKSLQSGWQKFHRMVAALFHDLEVIQTSELLELLCASVVLLEPTFSVDEKETIMSRLMSQHETARIKAMIESAAEETVTTVTDREESEQDSTLAPKDSEPKSSVDSTLAPKDSEPKSSVDSTLAPKDSEPKSSVDASNSNDQCLIQ